MSSIQEHNEVFIHEGHVSRVQTDSIVVVLNPSVECSNCHARGACGVRESDNKEIEVFNTGNSFKTQQRVTVELKKTTGMKAVFWAYVLPFLLMSVTLVLAAQLAQEWLAGLLSLLILIPYYLTLYLLKDHLKQRFQVSVLKT